MILTGIITLESFEYNAETNSFYIEHGLNNLNAIPYSITLKNSLGMYSEIVPNSVDFQESGITVNLGSLPFNSGDEISYMFNAVAIDESSDSSSNSGVIDVTYWCRII